ALCCSPPLCEGQDTEYASYRLRLWRRWPGNGVPPRRGSAAEYRRYVEVLLSAVASPGERSSSWRVRCRAMYATVERAATEACARADDAAVVAAQAHAIVVAAAQGRLAEWAPAGFSAGAVHALLAENEWRAACDGVDAWLVAPDAPEARVAMREAIRGLAAQ